VIASLFEDKTVSLDAIDRRSGNRLRKRPNVDAILKLVGKSTNAMGIPCPRCGSAMRRCANTLCRSGMVRRFRKCTTCRLRIPTLELPEQLVISVLRMAAMALDPSSEKK